MPKYRDAAHEEKAERCQLEEYTRRQSPELHAAAGRIGALADALSYAADSTLNPEHRGRLQALDQRLRALHGRLRHCEATREEAVAELDSIGQELDAVRRDMREPNAHTRERRDRRKAKARREAVA